MEEVVGSNPTRSTKSSQTLTANLPNELSPPLEPKPKKPKGSLVHLDDAPS